MNFKSTISLILLSVTSVSCATSIKWTGDIASHKADYLKEYKKFRAELCSKNDELKFQEKLKAYRGTGYWIPEYGGEVDKETIKELLPEIEQKLAWIKSQKSIVKTKAWPKKSVTLKLRSIQKELLDLKKDELSDDEELKTKSRQASLKLLTEMKREYDKLTSDLSFLTNYKFPMDHLKNRKIHDVYKESLKPEDKKKANYAFFYRKIHEDGAYNKDHTSPDLYLRTTLDTVYFELREHGFFQTEDARYDLEFVLDKIESELARGKDRALERLTEWEKRVQEGYEFYSSLTKPENEKKSSELIKNYMKASLALKDFVYEKEAEVYKYWYSRNELMKAVYVLETILLNEVGPVDGKDALERIDVSKVVMNRLDKPKYLTISESELIYPYLIKKMSKKEIKDGKWLNALFKQGEFSFSYYYIPGVVNIFCPDEATSARRLRDENIEIALRALKDEPGAFTPTRYFSRASMVGRIHMETIWDNYGPYPERAGLLATEQESLRESFKKGDYLYLYSFTDPVGEIYQVLKFNERTFALKEAAGQQVFYNYRNPHLFRYFTKR
ncbi:MAG: hypothetical protein ACOVP4_11935 [Bacteriovoracaceae bacterium]